MMQPSSQQQSDYNASSLNKSSLKQSQAAPLQQQQQQSSSLPTSSQSLPPSHAQGPRHEKDTTEKIKEGWETFKEKAGEAWHTVKEKTVEAYHDIRGDDKPTSSSSVAGTGVTSSSVDASNLSKPSTSISSSINPAAPGIPYSASETSTHTGLHPVSGTASTSGAFGSEQHKLPSSLSGASLSFGSAATQQSSSIGSDSKLSESYGSAGFQSQPHHSRVGAANQPSSNLGDMPIKGASGSNPSAMQSSFAGKSATSGASTLGGTSSTTSGVTKPL